MDYVGRAERLAMDLMRGSESSADRLTPMGFAAITYALLAIANALRKLE